MTYTSHETAEEVADGSINVLIISGMAVVILCVVHLIRNCYIVSFPNLPLPTFSILCVVQFIVVGEVVSVY